MEMSIEWSNQNKYNSFNSFKGLAYYENYKAIVKWVNGKGSLPPPIECSLDPIALCNLKCYYCNSQRYLRDNPIGGELSQDYMKRLIDFLANWGVKGLCWGGGGESILSKNMRGLTYYAVSKGMQVSIITNASVIDDELAEELIQCRWIGISLDAGDRETFQRIKGVDLFAQVITNIWRLVKAKNKQGSPVDLGCKVLVLPENIDSLYQICKLAKSLGFQDFHIRPVDLERKDFKTATKLNLDMPKIMEIFQKCHEEETGNFRVYTVMHKYDNQFHIKHDFDSCLASPLVIQCCTDGYAYVCVDHRIEEQFELGAHYPDPEGILKWWGGQSHWDILQTINPHTECARCTWGIYNQQIEECVIQDKLCVNFP